MFKAIESYLSENPVVAISLPLYTVLITAEVFLSQYQHRRYYSLKETIMNFWLNIANTLLGLSIKGFILLILAWISSYGLVTITQPYVYWTLLFLGVDLCFYIEHRCEHYSRFLWAVHVTHHSSQEFNLTTGFRSSVFRPFVSFWFFIPLVLLGFKPLDILFMDAFCQIYGILVHTRFVRKMPHWFEKVFVSPSHHRVHHASNILYLDKNMGMVLIIWDRLFGTFQEELETEPVVYGLTKNPESPHHPFRIIFHEWHQIFKDLMKPGATMRDRLHYLLDAPGWSHDGSSKTAKELRKQLYSEKQNR
ncbi:MAG: sterol desaturase family protein [Chitinophagaceae bacterium]|nr:sterol desaturase family protein [Chitinophagaceae bacterium]